MWSFLSQISSLRHDIETRSTLLVLCLETVASRHKRIVMQIFNILVVVSLRKLLHKQLSCRRSDAHVTSLYRNGVADDNANMV